MIAGDITLCPGGDCPLRKSCVRFVAERPARFDAFGAPPYDAAMHTCRYFMPTDDAIRVTAYFLWLAEGCPEGKAAEHWARAKAFWRERAR